MVSQAPARLRTLLFALPIVAAGACQMLSGLEDLEVEADPAAAGGSAAGGGSSDAAFGSGGTADGAGGAGARGGAAGSAGSSSGGALGTGGTSGAHGRGGSGGALGTAGTAGADGGPSGSGGTAGSGTEGRGGSSGTTGGGGSSGTTGGGGSSGTTGGGGSGGMGGAPECAAPADCPAESNECAHRACNLGRCELEPEPRNTPVLEQTSGDCRRRVCDGSGNVISINDDTDPKDDGKVCTRNVCNQGVPAHPPEPVNTPCGINTKCDGGGRCVGCTANSDCPADTPCTDWSCDNNGTCSSAPRSTATACGPAASCSGGVERPQDYCDGAGACRDSGSAACSPFVCGAASCLSACSADSHCMAGYYCAAAGSCQPKKTMGSSCSANAQCASGFCVDGVCCETACGGLCNTCNGVDAGGLPPGYCFPIAVGRDPAGECGGGRACNGQGACTGVQQCDCINSLGGSNEKCCSGCQDDPVECPSELQACNDAQGMYCTSIGNVTSYRSGAGVVDQSCSSGKRCAVVSCTCAP